MKSEVYNIYENERSPVLIAKFKNGFASDFFFEIPESFKDSLDIKWTEKTVDKNKRLILTQGSNYNFQKGEVIYDKKEVYQLTWGDALNTLRYFIKVINSSPAKDTLQKTIIIDGGVRSEQGETKLNKSVKEVETIQISKYKYEAGTVEFILSEIKDKNIQNARTFNTTQENFVVFLQSGKLFHNNELIIDLV